MIKKTKQAKESTGNQLLVNISTLVDNSAIRTETIEGVEFTVLPSKTLPPNIVMNRILYEDENVDGTIDTLDGSPATLGHPVVNGKFADAYDMMSQAKYGLGGAFNKLRGKDKNGLRMVDKYVPTEVLTSTERGNILANAIAKGLPIHTSTGVYLNRIPTIGVNSAGQEYDYIADIKCFNHDAILVGEIGAATPEQGVGIFVNADGEQEVEVMYCNLNLSSGDDYSMSAETIKEMLEEAAKQAFCPDMHDCKCEVEDFTDSSVIVECMDKKYKTSYSIDGDKAVLSGDVYEVKEKYTFTQKVGKIISKLTSFVKSDTMDSGSGDMPQMPMNNSREGDQVEKQEVQQMIADALAVNAEQTAKTVQDAIVSAFAANKVATEQAEKDDLIQQVVNAKLLPEEAAKECGIAALRGLIANQKQPAFGLNANRATGDNNADPFADYKFEG